MNRKLQILDALQNSKGPLSLNDLYGMFNATIAKRTISRYLHNLYEAQQINFLGNKKNRKYQAITPLTIEQVKEHAIFSKDSSTVIQRLQIPLYLREPCTYKQDFLLQYEPNFTYYFTTEQRQLLHSLGNRTIEEEPAGTYAHKIYERLLIDLSYNSSRLEGNTYSILDTRQLLLYGKSAIDKLDSEKVMILNHKDAIRFLVDSIENVQIDEKNICTLHYLLADGLVLPEDAGRIRRDTVKVSGSVYTPLDNHLKIQEIFRIILNKAAQVQDPFEQSLFLLCHLSYLQAYIDVNKRTARLAANISLIKNNLVPLSFNDVTLEDYRAAMIAVYEFNQILPLIDLYLWSYNRTSKQYSISAQAMGFDALRIKYRMQRRQLLHDIIMQKIVLDIDKYVQQFAHNNIPNDDQQKFIADCMLDINNLDPITIAGLGVSSEQLLAWQRKIDSNEKI